MASALAIEILILAFKLKIDQMKLYSKIVACLFSLAIISCGDGKKEKKEEKFQYEQESTSASKASDAEEDQNTVVITANDMMKFNKSEIRVKAGQKVTITLKHIGKLDKKVMGHNLVILKQDVDLVEFATAATAATENDYIPEGTDAVVAHTKLLGGGESDTIEFEAPAPGTYDFLCSFPGHFAAMQGKFIVE
ncbi:azurin [Galbibacter pacificus]